MMDTRAPIRPSAAADPYVSVPDALGILAYDEADGFGTDVPGRAALEVWGLSAPVDEMLVWRRVSNFLAEAHIAARISILANRAQFPRKITTIQVERVPPEFFAMEGWEFMPDGLLVVANDADMWGKADWRSAPCYGNLKISRPDLAQLLRERSALGPHEITPPAEVAVTAPMLPLAFGQAAIATTKKAEQEMKEWLVALMRGGSAPIAKLAAHEKAVAAGCRRISGRAFERVWAMATELAEAPAWSIAGRRKVLEGNRRI